MRHALAALLSAAVVAAHAPAEAAGLHDLELLTIDGAALPRAAVVGKVVLVVNVASFCSFTPQYAELQRLHDTYGDRGLLVLGVPCNQFGGQEPGSEREIKNFCSTTYGVTFPLLRKQDVNGATRSPLYRFLVGSRPGNGKDVGWNFEKFLVGRDGSVLGRFGSTVSPSDPNLLAAIELALSRSP